VTSRHPGRQHVSAFYRDELRCRQGGKGRREITDRCASIDVVVQVHVAISMKIIQAEGYMIISVGSVIKNRLDNRAQKCLPMYCNYMCKVGKCNLIRNLLMSGLSLH